MSAGELPLESVVQLIILETNPKVHYTSVIAGLVELHGNTRAMPLLNRAERAAIQVSTHVIPASSAFNFQLNARLISSCALSKDPPVVPIFCCYFVDRKDRVRRTTEIEALSLGETINKAQQELKRAESGSHLNFGWVHGESIPNTGTTALKRRRGILETLLAISPLR